MPTIHRESGFRFFFYMNEGTEPPHVHIQGHGGEMKVWIPSLDVEFSYKLSPREQRIVMEIIAQNTKQFMEKWNESAAQKK